MKEDRFNFYFNTGKYNHPKNIGYVMNSIRECRPLTIEEWEFYYFDKVRSHKHIETLASQMHNDIPQSLNITCEQCLSYFHDVIIRRTFEGYNKENQALKILRKKICPDVRESPKEWDGEYFIDFVIKRNNLLIGIQLKPETFYTGNYNHVVNIDEKLKSFRTKYNSKTFILRYKKGNENEIEFLNSSIIEEIKDLLKDAGDGKRGTQK